MLPSQPGPTPANSRSATDLESVCADARRLRVAADASLETLRDARRELTDATRRLDLATRDADRHAIADRKAAAARIWREAMAEATDEDGRRDATATWMRSISDLNRRTHRAVRQLTLGRDRLAALQATVAQADLAAAAARIRAEAAEAACTEARHRRVAREDALGAAAGRAMAGDPPLGADATPTFDRSADGPLDGAAATAAEGGDGIEGRDVAAATSPLRPADSETVRRLLAGDRALHEAIAGELAEMSGSLPARYVLLLDTLVNELTAAAVDAGELRLDHTDPLWGQFSPDEARLIIRGLRDLGFRLDLHEGWYGGRAPTAADLASALGFAGRDLRSLRGVPSAAELRELPRSVMVSPHDHLRRIAPDLTLDQMLRALGGRGGRLGELWDEWGRVRPLLANGLPAAA